MKAFASSTDNEPAWKVNVLALESNNASERRNLRHGAPQRGFVNCGVLLRMFRRREYAQAVNRCVMARAYELLPRLDTGGHQQDHCCFTRSCSASLPVASLREKLVFATSESNAYSALPSFYAMCRLLFNCNTELFADCLNENGVMDWYFSLSPVDVQFGSLGPWTPEQDIKVICAAGIRRTRACCVIVAATNAPSALLIPLSRLIWNSCTVCARRIRHLLPKPIPRRSSPRSPLSNCTRTWNGAASTIARLTFAFDPMSVAAPRPE